MMIIEINGLPGIGKTTVAKALGSILEENKRKCIYRYETQKSFVERYIGYLFDGSIPLYFLLSKYVKTFENDRMNRIRIASTVVFYYRMYRDFEKKHLDEIMIIDQGIVQALISIAYASAIPSFFELEAIIEYIEKKVHFLRIDCINAISISNDRIITRNTSAGRLDVLKEEKRVSVLEIQKHNFKVVRAVSDRISANLLTPIDTQSRPEVNAELIVGVLREKGLII